MNGDVNGKIAYRNGGFSIATFDYRKVFSIATRIGSNCTAVPPSYVCWFINQNN
jgi:hypothetical protein